MFPCVSTSRLLPRRFQRYPWRRAIKFVKAEHSHVLRRESIETRTSVRPRSWEEISGLRQRRSDTRHISITYGVTRAKTEKGKAGFRL
ncbi:hypothetical protein PUN28_007801 [Cardiocondyla obscurior]|uniref:Uncharacterized protein n=1 Tax=Cardiocondyla obscurior TaxID=286306 RepID=A0AAW2G0H0_9HYME